MSDNPRRAVNMMGSDVIDEIKDGGDHTFEQEIAYRYYHNGESRIELPKNYHNWWMANSSVWDFDSKGNGVFAIYSDTSMQQSYYLFEYTKDYGETWTIGGERGILSWIEDIKVNGNRLVITAGNHGVTDFCHDLMYLDDLNDVNFNYIDTSVFDSDEISSVMPEKGYDFSMDILSLNSDGSLILGWYKRNEIKAPELRNYEESEWWWSEKDYFMIGEIDPEMTMCEVLYTAENE